jgi:hypothetical protein
MRAVEQHSLLPDIAIPDVPLICSLGSVGLFPTLKPGRVRQRHSAVLAEWITESPDREVDVPELLIGFVRQRESAMSDGR